MLAAILIGHFDILNVLEILGLVLTLIISASTVIALVVTVVQKIYCFFNRKDVKQNQEISDIKMKLSKVASKVLEMDTKQNETNLELYKKIAADNKRLESLEEGESVTQLALLALLGHAQTGNNAEELADAKAELAQHITRYSRRRKK